MLPDNRRSIVLLQKKLGTLLKAGYAPQDIIAIALGQLAEAKLPALSGSLKLPKVKNEPIIKAFSSALVDLDLFAAAFWLSSSYAYLKGSAEQKLKSLYFTPPYLSNRVLDNTGPALLAGKLVDPACGGAAFLAPAAARIAQSLSTKGCTAQEILLYLEENIYGSDIDPFLCKLSSIFLKMALSKEIDSAGFNPSFKIRSGNGLIAFKGLIGTFDLVLCNPPYRKMARTEAIGLKSGYAEIMKGQPNIYSLFINRSTKLLKTGGTAVLLTPMSYLSGEYFSKLRYALLKEGTVRQIDLIHDKCGVFLGVEQDTIVTVWQKGETVDKKTSIYALSVIGGGESTYVGTTSFKESEKPWHIPRRPTDTDLLQLLEKCEFNLASYGYKPRTGAIVIHRDARGRYKDERGAESAHCPIPIIWQSDIRQDGTLVLGNNAKNDACFIDMMTDDCPSIVKGPVLALQRVTSPDQKRRLICAPVPDSLRNIYGGVVGENHVCLIERVSLDSCISPKFLAAILRTEIIDRLFRCISGATNVSAYELSYLPLPNPNKVAEHIANGISVEDAVFLAFGLPKTSGPAASTKNALAVKYGDKIGGPRAIQL
jgi:hypothetical protein